LRQILEQKGIVSLIAAPLMERTVCHGFVGFEFLHHRHSPTEKEEILLRAFGQLLVNVSARRRVDKALAGALEGTVTAVGHTVEYRDPYTAGHQRRVAELSVAIALEMGLPDDTVKGLRVASLLHELGKVAIPTEILTKPGKLNKNEFDLIKTHSVMGYRILKDISFPWPVARIAHEHHERLDGSGYPRGLKGEEMLLESMILALADTVEAIASHRPYRAALGLDFALKEISDHRGKRFHPGVVDACLRLFREKNYALPERKTMEW
jgi:putative nucleotidyltransferase with HDIG domain